MAISGRIGQYFYKKKMNFIYKICSLIIFVLLTDNKK